MAGLVTPGLKRWSVETVGSIINEAGLQEPLQGVIETAAKRTLLGGGNFYVNPLDTVKEYPRILAEVGPETAASTLLTNLIFAGMSAEGRGFSGADRETLNSIDTVLGLNNGTANAKPLTTPELKEKILTEAQKSSLWRSEEAKNLHDTMKRRYVEDGGMDEELAEANADFLTAFAINMKERNPESDLTLEDFANVTLKSLTKSVQEWAAEQQGETEAHHQIIGEKGAADAGNRIENLGIARQMEQAGKDARTIRLATGWEKGKEGKWGYEVMDGEVIKKTVFTSDRHLERSEIKKLRDTINATCNLGDVFDAPELYAAYPELRDMKVIVDSSFDGNAAYLPVSKSIKISPSYLSDVSRGITEFVFSVSARSVLVHEIQHAIQDIEGFARGGSTWEMGGQTKASLLMNNTFENAPEETKRVINRIADWLHEQRATRGSLLEEKSASEVEQILSNVAETLSEDVPAEQKDVFWEVYNRFRERYKEKESGIKGAYSDDEKYDLYNALAGEVQARNASARMNMTAEERRAKLLEETEDVSREDQIVLMDALGAESRNMSVAAEAKLAADEKAWWELIYRFNSPEGIANAGRKTLLPVMQTPLVFKLVGMDLLPIEIRLENLDKNLKGKHQLNPETLKQVPRALADPVMIFNSEHDASTQRDSRVILLELKEPDPETGVIRNIIAAIKLGRKNVKKGYAINELTSVFRKDTSSKGQLTPEEDILDWIKKEYKTGEPMNLLRYINREKTLQWCVTEGLSPEVLVTNEELLKSIPNETDLAKLRNQPEHETHYQRAWAGSRNEFDAFDPQKVGSGVGTQWQGWAWIYNLSATVRR